MRYTYLATAYSNGTIRKACNDTRLHGYGMMQAKRNVVICVCWLLIHFYSQLTLRLACDPNIHAGQGATVLHFHDELNPTMLLVQVLKQSLDVVFLHHENDVIHEPAPYARCCTVRCESLVFQIFHENISDDQGAGEPIATPSSCL